MPVNGLIIQDFGGKHKEMHTYGDKKCEKIGFCISVKQKWFTDMPQGDKVKTARNLCKVKILYNQKNEKKQH